MAPNHVLFCNQLIPAESIEQITMVQDNADTLFLYTDQGLTWAEMRPLREWLILPSLICWFEVKVRDGGDPVPRYWASAPVPRELHDELSHLKQLYADVMMMPNALKHMAADLSDVLGLLLGPLRLQLAEEAYVEHDRLHMEWHRAVPHRQKVLPMHALR